MAMMLLSYHLLCVSKKLLNILNDKNKNKYSAENNRWQLTHNIVFVKHKYLPWCHFHALQQQMYRLDRL